MFYVTASKAQSNRTVDSKFFASRRFQRKNPQSADIPHFLVLRVLEQESVSWPLPISADCFMVNLVNSSAKISEKGGGRRYRLHTGK
jgi:hypothetical protein